MDYLSLQFSNIGYPAGIFYLVAAVGLFLVFYNPDRAFLFAVFGLAARNFHAAIFTRIELTGQYLNLNDLFLWIAFTAWALKSVRAKASMYIPPPLLLISIALSLGCAISIFKYGMDAFVLREMWSALIFPIMFFVSANLMDSESKAKSLYWALFYGAVVAAGQHAVSVALWTASGITEAHLLRTISYSASGGVFLLIAALYLNAPEKKRRLLLTYYAGLVLIALSYLMTQTRQMYMVFLAVMLVIPFIVGKAVKLRGALLKATLVSFAVLSLSLWVFGDQSLIGVLSERLSTINSRNAISESYLTRWLGIKTEVDIWLESPFFLGTGVAYPPELIESYRGGDTNSIMATGALNHVALTSYLAHYGIFGVIAYLVVLPLTAIVISRKLLNKGITYIRVFALIAVSVSLSDVINMLGSSLHILPASHIPAILYGSVWGLFFNQKKAPAPAGRSEDAIA